MTNHGIEFTKKKMGLRETVYQISQKKEKKKMGVMTNHGIEFTKKDGFQSNDISDLIGERKKRWGSRRTMEQNLLKKRWV